MSKEILILPGDGVGQEVMASASDVLDFVINEYNLDFLITSMSVGGTAYNECGSPIPKEVLDSAKKADAILFGAVGGTEWDNLDWEDRPENALLTLRKELNLFANLRPAFLFNELSEASPLKKEVINDLDILIVRELTGGIYFGEPRGIVSNEEPNYAFNTMIYNEEEIRRIAKVAFESEMSSDYPDVELSHQLADNTAMQLVLNPNQFDVIVSSNLFGDILSDIAATLTGSIGMLPSASLDSSFKGMFEPCHGSAPDIAGKNLANPLAMISSLSMALRYSLNQADISDKIDNAIKKFIQAGYRTIDIASDGDYLMTSDVAKKIIEIIKDE